jgi:hypothetical protein
MNAMTASAEHVAATFDVAPLLERLPRLGPVLCLYPAKRCAGQDLRRPADAPWPLQHELTALLAAAGTRAEFELSSEGLNERIWFLDPSGRPQFGLWLLPDTDYLAWDALIAKLVDERRDITLGPGWCERLRARWQWRLANGCAWCAGAHRFGMACIDGRAALALLPVARLSALGSERMERIAAGYACSVVRP